MAMESEPVDRPADPRLASYGQPEVVYAPSPGQTFAGVAVGVMIAVAGFGAALFGEDFGPWNRLGAAGIGVSGVVLAYWICRLRRWRLAICPGGLVQTRAWSVDAVAWNEVREVVQTRFKGIGEPTIRVTLHTSASKVVVNPVNLRTRREMFRSLLAAAGRRGIPVRVEWEESD